MDPQFQQAMQVGGAPTKRNWNTNFNKQCKLAGPHKEKLEHQFQQAMQVGEGQQI
ncbi:hypothetical protein UM538_07015 [Staphylococcus aureus]|nr:hypothetical protein UM538_07015 [Staphylococcus aureus]